MQLIKSKVGFTLIELILGIALLALIVAMLMPMLVGGFGYIATAGHRTSAYFSNQGQVDVVFNQRHQDINLSDYADFVSGTDDKINISYSNGDTFEASGYVLNKKVSFSGREVNYVFFHPGY
jgi:type II secretory pathway pseudopilin PulG